LHIERKKPSRVAFLKLADLLFEPGATRCDPQNSAFRFHSITASALRDETGIDGQAEHFRG
jgi:hypothetical protein